LAVGLHARVGERCAGEPGECRVQWRAKKGMQLGIGARGEALRGERVVHAARERPARVDQHAVEVEGDAQNRPSAPPACLTRSNSGEGTMPPASVAAPNATATKTTSGSARRVPSDAATVGSSGS